MEVKFLDSNMVNTSLLSLMQHYDEYYWAIAWATDNDLIEHFFLNHQKIRKFIVGIDFLHTSPSVLARLQPYSTTRVALDHESATFHPKVYYFKRGNECAAIVGSANFTAGGLGLNDEAAILLTGNVDDAVFRDIETAIETWWSSSSLISQSFLDAYTQRWHISQRTLQYLKRPFRISTPSANSRYPKLCFIDWDDYVNTLNNSYNPNIEERLELIRKAKELFIRRGSFSAMSELERKAIAGFIGTIEVEQDSFLLGTNWGWFGSMKGAGVFKNRVNENDENLNEALEHIPTTGMISIGDYINFINSFNAAFVGASRQGGLPTASRLLAMKRPDYFVCVDSENLVELARDLGFKKSSLNLDTYWSLVIEPIIDSKWWNSPRPLGLQGHIWDARTALLDVIYYKWDE
ncbi:phospholipase D family protein [Aeromonas veronii]